MVCRAPPGRLQDALARHSVVWVSGVRRVGKTVLCQSLPTVEYFADEVHRLDNPSEILKIAADHFRDVRIVATGSSTLGASATFRDTLTGRKAEMWLTPMRTTDLEDFAQPDLGHRLLRGGLPPFFLADQSPERDFQDWRRDKRGHEVDLVWAPRGRAPIAIDCTWSASDFDASNIKAFRYQYPRGERFIVAQDITRGHRRRYGDVDVRFVALHELIDAVRRYSSPTSTLSR